MPTSAKLFASILLLLFVSDGLRHNAAAQNDGENDPTVIVTGEKLDFARDVQPIFAKHCYKCHGPDVQESGLRLDTKEGSLGELESGDVAIEPGDAAASLLLDRVKTEDEFWRMPPEGEGLSDEEIARVERWIAEGAEWNKHWAYRELVQPEVPEPQANGWVRSPIDAFVLQKLEAAGLKPAPPASKLSWIRRASYDLTGLPPTATEVDEFLADDSPEAYEKVLDRLLASQQYGEKWARHWLDLVRYAETNGYERDSRKQLIWKYRDYVIRAFNEDKPYDRFLVEQLAGDELPDADADSITATGFFRLGIWDDEPADRELARYDYLDDIVRTTSEGFLGMTVGCARCHDHKIDPISQRDYYSMLAFFADISDQGKGDTNHVPIASAADRAGFERRVAEKQKREAELQRQIATLTEQVIAQAKKAQPDLDVPAFDPQEGWQKKLQVVSPTSEREGTRWSYTTQQPANNWFEIAFDDKAWQEALGGFGRRGTPGARVRTEWHSAQIWLRRDFRLSEVPSKLLLKIHHDEDAVVYLNGQIIAELSGYTTGYEEIDVTAAAREVLQTGRNTLAITCRQTAGGQYIDAGLAVRSADPVGDLVQRVGQEKIGEELLRTLRETRQALLASQQVKLEFKPEMAMAVTEKGPQTTWILQRGLPAAKGEEVTPAFPEILDPPVAAIESPKETKTAGKRLALAQWIVSPENPIAPRVAVNRIWQHHFGRGLVRTSSDFGYQGTPPTHPQLLDWLAVEFINKGWSLKKLHKEIMLSNTYRMSSQPNEQALAIDPANDLFWRFNMRRLTAEEIRDSILNVTGTLNAKMFGPPVFPKLSDEVLATSSRPDAAWGQSPVEEATRRTIYVHVKRSLRPPMLTNFDAPDTDNSCAVRMETTVPTQALGMLNSDFMVQQATQLAERLRDEVPQDLSGQVRQAVQWVTGRTPSAEEVAADVRFVQELMEEEQLSIEKAMQAYCLMMLNTNEFVYLD